MPLILVKYLLCSNCTLSFCLCSGLFSDSGTAINVLFFSLLYFLEPLLALCQLFLSLSFQSFQQQNMLLAFTKQVVKPSFNSFVALLVTAYTSGRNALLTSLTINLCQNAVHFKGFPIIHNISIAMHVVKA